MNKETTLTETAPLRKEAGRNDNELTDGKITKPIPGDECEICFDDKIDDLVAMIIIAGCIVMTEGNISVSGGKAKVRKTFFISMIITGYIMKNYDNVSAGENENGTVLIFDTEQGKSHVHNVLLRIHRMCGFTKGNNRIRMFYLRELTIDERIAAVEAQIKKHKPALVIIDGVVDICRNFNDIEASTETTQLLMRLSSECHCHIHCVLHENKGDGNLRGHLGSILTQKCETVLQLQKDGNVTKVSAAYTRNMPFEDFYFSVNTDGMPYITGDAAEKKETSTDTMVRVARQILDGEAMEYTTLVQMYSEFAGKAESTAKKHISVLLSMSIIYKSDDNKYRCTKYR